MGTVTHTLNLWTKAQIAWRGLDADRELIAKVMSASACSLEELSTAMLKAADSKYSMLVNPLRQRVSALSSDDTVRLMSQLIEQAIEEKTIDQLLTLVDYFSSQRVRSMLPRGTDINQYIQENKNRLPRPLPNSTTSTWRKELHYSIIIALNFIPNLINTFLAALRLYEMGKEPENAWEASGIIDIYCKIFLIPHAISIFLQGIVAVPYVGLVTTIIVIVLVVLVYAYLRWWKPCPDTLEGCMNYTLEAKLGNITPITGRNRQISDLMKQYKKAPDRNRKGVLLVGESRVGKSSLVRTLAYRMAMKTNNKVQVFKIPVASLVDNAGRGYEHRLTMIFNRIRGYEKDVILFFDELGVVSKRPGLAEFLQDRLSEGKVRYIAAMTDEEYAAKPFSKSPLSKRFRKKEIASVSDRDALCILRQEMNRYDQVIFDSGIRDAIYDIAKEQSGPNPEKALDFLEQCVEEVEQGADAYPLKNELYDKQSQLSLLEEEDLSDTARLREEVQELQKEVDLIDARVEKMHSLIKKEKEIHKALRQFFQNCADNTPQRKKNAFMVQALLLLPAMKQTMNALENELLEKGIPMRVTADVVNNVARNNFNTGFIPRPLPADEDDEEAA